MGLFSYLSRSSVPLTLRVDELAAGHRRQRRGTPAARNPAPRPAGPHPAAPGSGASGRAGHTGLARRVRRPTPARSRSERPVPGPVRRVPRLAVGQRHRVGQRVGAVAHSRPAVAAAPAGAPSSSGRAPTARSVTIPRGKRLTVQAYPARRSGSTAAGRQRVGVRRRGVAGDGWTAQFDHSPTYTPGAPDGTAPTGDSSTPPTRWPPIPIRSRRRGGPAAGRLPGRGRAGDVLRRHGGRNRLYVGTNPAGQDVRASDAEHRTDDPGARAASCAGIGMQRYATPVPEKGALRLSAPDVTVENVVVRENATQASRSGAWATRRSATHCGNVTIERNGMLGIESSYSDGLLVDGRAHHRQQHRAVQQAPVSGGMKIGGARDLTVPTASSPTTSAPGCGSTSRSTT